MVKFRGEAKDKLWQATLAILDTGVDPEQITTRDIAERAGVNIALVNYYFQSKDNLIEQAIGIKMAGVAAEMYQPENTSADLVEKLRNMIKKNTELAFRYYSFMKKSLEFELKTGSYATVQSILPILKEIFHEQKTERELWIIALQLIVPLQAMGIYAEVYQKNLNLCTFDIEAVYTIIDSMVDNLLPKT